MWMHKTTRESLTKDVERAMLRSAFVSLFWNIMKTKGITRQQLSDKIGVNKSAPSRWFSEDRPNWRVDTIADIASALAVEIEVTAYDMVTGHQYSITGPVYSPSPVSVMEFPTQKFKRTYTQNIIPSGCTKPLIQGVYQTAA